MNIKRLSGDEQGRDPLVIAFQEQHGDNCARRGVSLPWIGLGLLLTLLGAVACSPALLHMLPLFLHDLFGFSMYQDLDSYNTARSAYKDALFDHWLIFSGLGLGYVVASVSSLILSRSVATVQECLYGLFIALFIYAVLYGLNLEFSVSAGIATAVICLVYLLAIVFRLLAFAVGWFKPPADVEDVEMLEWPVYTILVPLYKEKNVASNIIRSLSALDYPHDKLDVKLLLEANDQETLDALEAAHVPDWIEILIVPDAQPRTKPRACNHGLASATGEYLVIFDAEDKPDPDQLKKAVLRFDELNDDKVVCVQASLAYHNYKQNLLTRLFAIEYNMWFTRFQPGLVKLGGPLPLGGTSNHFKIEALKEVGGWDPYNVTEDCDLGVRLHAHGYTCDLLASTTWEEANSRVGNWLRQRSRWIKGYMITHVVWFRHPLRLLKQLGLMGFSRFIMVVSSVGLLAVANPFLWALLLYWFIAIGHDLQMGYDFWELLTTRDELKTRWSWPMLFLEADEDPRWSMISQILFTLSCILFMANFVFVLIACVYGARPGQKGLFWAALLSPFYWVLMSIASWKALYQLIVRPHYWEKTVHGLDHADGDDDATAPDAVLAAANSGNDPSQTPAATDDPAADESSQ